MSQQKKSQHLVLPYLGITLQLLELNVKVLFKSILSSLFLCVNVCVRVFYSHVQMCSGSQSFQRRLVMN